MTNDGCVDVSVIFALAAGKVNVAGCPFRRPKLVGKQQKYFRNFPLRLLPSIRCHRAIVMNRDGAEIMSEQVIWQHE